MIREEKDIRRQRAEVKDMAVNIAKAKGIGCQGKGSECENDKDEGSC